MVGRLCTEYRMAAYPYKETTLISSIHGHPSVILVILFRKFYGGPASQTGVLMWLRSHKSARRQDCAASSNSEPGITFWILVELRKK